MNSNRLQYTEQVCVNALPSSVFFRNNVDSGAQILKGTFNRFIKSRTRYLDKLKSLGNNWISGNSQKPDENNINAAKKILSDLEVWYSMRGCTLYNMPKIVMSPTPDGGIYLEIELQQQLKTWIKLFNSNVEMEVEKCGHFKDVETTIADVNASLIDLYTTHEFLAHSQWRNTFPICQSFSSSARPTGGASGTI